MYETQTYESILERVLARMPGTLDKRETSFLYNAAAPVAIELQNMFIAIDNILNISYFDTADREGKIQRCKERGVDITQFDATNAVCVLAILPAATDIPEGTRFSYDNINYTVIEKISDGFYYVQCDTSGVIGNITGDVIPVEYIDGLVSAKITDIYQWGEDEADESLIDEAYYNSLHSQAFGGNRADYIEKMKKIAGVGGVKIYSAKEWKGGGTTKLVFTTSSYTKPLEEFVNHIQTLIDPLENQGAGYGIAPIGHTVTVVGVEEESVNITMNISLESGYAWEDVSEYVNNAIDDYFNTLNAGWEDSGNIIVRISQIETRILDIAGILDVSGTSLNGVEENLVISKDAIVIRGDIDATT